MPKILKEMFYNLKPKSRYSSQQHIQQYTDSIYKQIINGDLDVSKNKTNLQDNPHKKEYEEVIRKRFLNQAEKQKYELSHKLDYISNSINALKKYEQGQNVQSLSKSYSIDSRLKEQGWRSKIKERQENLKKLKDQAEERKLKKEEEQKQIEERMKKQQIQNRRKQILESMKKIKERMDNREEVKKAENQRYLKIRKQKKLHERISQNYQERQESFLEERKKKLAQIRSLHQPINEEQIRQHEQKFLQLKKQKEQLREKQIKMSQSRSKSYKPLYMSSYYRQIKEEAQKTEEDDPNAAKLQKMKQFSERLKKKFKPSVDERKQEQVLDFIRKQKKAEQIRIRREEELLQKSRQKGLQYLTKLRDLPKKKKEKEIQKIASKTDRIIYQNYLTHERAQNHKNSWNKILNSSDDKQSKALKLQFESQRIQNELKWKQVETRVMKKDDTGEIDQEYYNMIKAKLDLLSQK